MTTYKAGDEVEYSLMGVITHTGKVIRILSDPFVGKIVDVGGTYYPHGIDCEEDKLVTNWTCAVDNTSLRLVKAAPEEKKKEGFDSAAHRDFMRGL